MALDLTYDPDWKPERPQGVSGSAAAPDLTYDPDWTPSKRNTGLASDLATDLKRGVQKLPGALTGLADIPVAALTGDRYVSRAADALGEVTGFQPGKWADAAADEYSPQRKAGAEAIERAWQNGSAGDVAGAYLRNPGNVAGLVAESIPSMFAGGLVGRAALAGAARLAPAAAAAPLAPVIAGAGGEGAIIAGQTMAGISDDVDARRAAAASAAAGLAGSALGVGGGAFARRLGVIDPETAIAGGVAATGRAPMGLTRRLVGGATAEGLLQEMPQSVTEQALQNWAEEQPLGEGVARAAVEGTMAGGLLGAGANVVPAGAPAPTVDPNAGPLSRAASLAQANQAAMTEQQRIVDEEAGTGSVAGDPRAAWSMEQARRAQEQAAAVAAERVRAAEQAAQQDAAENEIAGATGVEAQAENLDFNRFVGEQAAELETLRTRAADTARLERAGVREEMRTARDQLTAEGAFEAEQRARDGRRYDAGAMPFERILPEDFDTLNPIRAGQGEVMDAERTPARALPPPEQQGRLPPPEDRRARSLEYRPQPSEPLRATSDGQVGTPQQFEELDATRAVRREQMRVARERARFVTAEAEARAARTVPYTEQTAQREAERLSSARQEAFTVVPHPGRSDRFAVVPARAVTPAASGAPSAAPVPAPMTPQTETVRGERGQSIVGQGVAAPSANQVPIKNEPSSATEVPPATPVFDQAAVAAPDLGAARGRRAQAADPVVVERIQRDADELRAMSQDAGWAEQGGHLLRDAEGKVSRTKWIARADWFMAGMEARPDVLAQHIEDTLAGRRVPAKSRRTIEGMLEWLDAQRGQATLDEDASMYDFEASFDDVLDTQDARDVADFFDDSFEPADFAELSEIDAMRALGFTEEEIADAAGQAQAGAGSTQAADAGGAAAAGERTGETGAAQEEAGGEGSGDGLTLDSYTNQEIADQELAQRDRIEADARAERDASERERQARERAEVRARSEAAAQTFELGMDPMENLTGQGGLFAAPVPQPQVASPKRPDVSTNTIFTEDAAAKARALLRKKLGQLNSGLDPEMLQAGITLAGYHIEKGARTFAAYARAMVEDLGDAVRPYLKSWYMGVKYDPRAARFDGMDSAATVEVADETAELVGMQPQEQNDVTDERGSRDLEQDRRDAGAEDGLGAQGVRAEPGRDGEAGGRGVRAPEGEGRSRRGGELPGREAAPAGKRGDLAVYTGGTDVSGSAARSDLDRRSADPGIDGAPVEPDAAESIAAASRGGSRLAETRAAQAAADATPHGNSLEDIRAALPALLPGQQEDVFKAEQQFAKPDGYGMLFTNGTGTGKTFTGLGVVKRFALGGRTNTLIVAPNDKIIEDWQKSGRVLGLDIGRLQDTKDAGAGIVVTTYANLGDNAAIVTRDWDLVIADESHCLMQDKDGTPTSYLRALRAITLHPDGVHRRHEMFNGEEIAERNRLAADAKMLRVSDDERHWSEAEKVQAKADALSRKLEAKFRAIEADVKARQGAARPRALFLSATPFAYEKTIEWGNGYLFDYNEGQPSEEGSFRGYNQGSNRERFFMQHLGYRMRTNKLTEPDAKVDSGLMQRQFNAWLKRRGSLSGRLLEVDFDYDRRFILVDSAIGTRIDAALTWLREEGGRIAAAGGDRRGVDALQFAINEQFDYLSRRYLLEAIKAAEVIPHVREHLAMGRKIVVFHDYKKGGGFNPFVQKPLNAREDANEDAAKAGRAYNDALDAFNRQFADLVNADFAKMPNPIEAFQRAFPDVLLVNGSVNPKVRRANVAKFQDDASGPQVILVQSAAGKEGISLHDTTGKHQRVLFNLGQPTQPTTAIQQEGRIYRTGQKSHAMFRYLNTGTNWEKWAFATTIAQRAGAAENLGAGEQARALKDAFIQGFEESDNYRAGMEGEGIGGKERDRLANEALTEYDRAKAFYFGQQKKNSKTKAQEGTDYFATPEPVGLKMVEWADLRPGERVLEPSAGHGAIARWMPENAERTAIEPSSTLLPRLAMVFDGKIVDSDFESLHVNNKFDAIVMNPPFGQGGKTAIEHVAKAAMHLRERGRIVALIPTGPAADKRFEKWFYESEDRAEKPVAVKFGNLPDIYRGDTVTARTWNAETIVGTVTSRTDDRLYIRPAGSGFSTSVRANEIQMVDPTGPRVRSVRPAEGLRLIADIKMPGVTFERAGTRVATRILVIEKQSDPAVAQNLVERQRDYTGVEDIGELFDRLQDFSLPRRAGVVEADPALAAPAEPDAPAAPGRVMAEGEAATVERIEGDKLVTDAPEVEHVTQKGKTLKGVIARGLTRDELREVDAYTFKKDGGYFVRLAHVSRPATEPGGRYTAQERGNRARKNDGYTQDLFGAPVSEVGRVPDTPRVQPGIAGAEALRAAGEIEGAKYAVEAGPRVTGFLKSAFERVESAPQAAHTLAGLRKYPQERFQVLVLDANDRPISVLNLFTGATTQTSVYPEVVTKAVYETPGAAKIWYAHNHPSGKAEPSNADAILTRSLSEAFGPGTGIEVMGHVVIAGTRAAELDAEGFEVGRAFSIPAGARTHSTKITERRFKKVGTLGRIIDSPAKAREDVPAIAGGKAGVVFLNAQHGPVGFLPMSVEQMRVLRDGKGARLLFGAAARSNASAAILHFPGSLKRTEVLSAASNLYEALSPRDVTLLDAFHGGDSLAERGELTGTGKGFMSLAGRNAGAPEADGLTREGLRQAITSRFPSLARPLDAMLKRGDEGRRGGVVVVEQADDLADVFSSKTGRSMDEAIQPLGSNQNGDIQGFFDPRSGLTFLVAQNLTMDTAPAVLLHEAVHGKQREEIDRKALQMIESRGTRAKPLREFLLRVAQRMEDAGESGHAAEAASYIVEQAVTEGRQAGFSAADGKLLNWIDTTIGKPVGDLVRGFVAMVRAWALRKGVSFDPTVDDLVAIARANVLAMARGEVTADHGARGAASIAEGSLSNAVMPREVSTFDEARLQANGTVEARNERGIRFSRASRLARSPSTITAEWESPEPSKLDSLIYTLQNKQVDMKRVVDAVKEQVGEIEDQWNPYLQEELFHGRSAKGVRDFLAHEMRPLVAEMRRSGVSMEELERFLHARHAPEANAHIAKINPDAEDLQDGGSGMTNQEAASHLAGIAPDRRRKLDALAQTVDSINANTRRIMVESGLETAETIQAWEAAYQHYVPLQREDVESGGLGIGQGYSVRGPASKRRTGSKKAVIDILANIALQRERTIVRAEKNRVAQANYALALKAPNPDFWMPVNPDEARAFTPAQQARMVSELVGMGLDPADAQNFVKEPVQRYVDPRTGLVAERINPALRGADNVLSLRIEGKDRFVFFNRKDERAQRMVHALKNLDADQLGHVFGVLAKLTRFFAAVNTQWNPIFGVVNLTRDTQAALLQLSTTPIRGSERAVLKNVLPAMRGIYAALRAERDGKALPNSPWAKAFDEFRNEGGQTGYRDMFSNSQERADALAKELDPERWMDSALGKVFTANGMLRVPMAQAQKMAGGLFNWLTDYNDTLENAVRLSAYMEAKAKGLSNQEAASVAKNLTVNFNRKGQIATQAGALYAFFNAAMQGTARMLQTLKGPAGRKIILGGLTLGALQAVTLAAAGFDDDEPPEFVRERSIVIPLGDGKYASIPMPLGFHVIPSTSRILTEWALSGFRDTTKRFGDFVALFADTFNPIGNAGWSMQTLAPTALDPVAALAENRDWTGKPIAQQDFNSLRPTPGHARARDTASELSKALAYWINLSTGGTDYKPGLISPTPDQIDYLIGQVTGGVGREYLKAEQTATSLWTGEELPPHKIPLLGRFYGDATGQSSEATRFYNNLREINLHRAEIEGRRKDGGDVQGYLRDNPAARIGMAGPIQVEGQVRKLREAKRIAVERGDSARVRTIDVQITTAMRRFNERVSAAAQ